MTEVDPEKILQELPPTAPEGREKALQLIATLAESLSEGEFNELVGKIKASGLDPLDFLFRYFILAKVEETKKKAAQNAINLLKDYGDEAVREQYGQGVLLLLREIQATPPERIEDEKYLAFYDALKSAEEHMRIMGETPDLPLDLPKAKPALPSGVMQTIAKITSEPNNIPTNGTSYQFSVDKEKKVMIRAGLKFPEEYIKEMKEHGIEIKYWKLSDFGLSIQDAVASMLEFGTERKETINGKEYNCFTESDLAILLGATGNTRGNIRQDIRREIETQTMAKGFIDWTEQLEDLKKHAQKNPERLKKLNEIESASEIADLLPLRIRKVKVKGHELSLYIITGMPLIAEYAKRAGEQRIFIPLSTLNVPGLNFTKENNSLMRYLVRYVAVSRHKKAPQNIRLETVLKRIGQESSPSRDKARIIDRVNRILENFKNTQFIKNFDLILGEKGNITGWTIEA